jgi:hypothetical protein
MHHWRCLYIAFLFLFSAKFAPRNLLLSGGLKSSVLDQVLHDIRLE